MPIRRPLAALSALLLPGCASAPTQHAYVAPTFETVFTTTEEMTTGPGQIVYVENRSSVRVTVYSVTLRDCQNIKASCTPRQLNLRLDPGNRVTLVRVEPANPQQGFNFRYSFGWRADSSTTAALGALAAGGDTVARQQLSAIQREEARRRGTIGAADLDLAPNEIADLASRAGSLRALPDSLVLRVGGRVTLDTVRVLLISTQGETLGRMRALQFRVLPGPVSLVRPDTIVAVSPGRTSLQLKLPDDVLPGRPSIHDPVQVPIVVRQ
jgi:hypothetical protein